MVAFKAKKIAYTASLAALAFVGGSLFHVSIGVVRVAPMQHLINLLTGVALGPWYGVSQAFIASVLRNISGTGTLLAFPGSMIGAFLIGIVYRRTSKLMMAGLVEIIGTGLIGGCVSYLLARYVLGIGLPLGLVLGSFFISTLVGVTMGYPLVKILRKRLPNLFGE
ncbi:energy coupling factor transporter S component ThiW [uncultured Vagococcus sp.]|uniref:energy coupling factor transporter S component ThiW n=1 Tax=uncultured Vagococcus sp. TaxID=189676 RepID=UPI0028D64E57|nr:energy coupling factor transporter S component ThiW [uncultured Vagococcus sp.]